MLIVKLSLSNRNTDSDKVLLSVEIQFKGKLLDDLKARILLYDEMLNTENVSFSGMKQ